MPSLFVAIPSRSGLSAGTAALAFVSLPSAIGQRGVTCTVRLLPGCSDIVQARRELAGEFVRSGADWLLHLDDDVWCDPSVIVAMLDANVDVAVAAYPGRLPPFGFTWCSIRGREPELLPGGQRVLEISGTGLGCCLVKRAVVERLCERHPDLEFVSYESGRTTHDLYRHTIDEIDGVRRGGGEDWAFYSRCRAAGYRVLCLVDAEMTHAGISGRLSEKLP